MKTITGIHGVPRSGTSWLAQIFNASPETSLKFQPLFSYAFKDYLNELSSKDEVENFFKEIYNTNDAFINMRDREIHKSYPIFKKNNTLDHLVFKNIRYHYLIETMLKKNNKVKFILIVRNPLAVLTSWKNAPREFNPNWSFEEEWKLANNKNLGRKEEYFGYLKWKEASSLFLFLKNKYPQRVVIVRYKDLLADTDSAMETLFKFSAIPLHDSVYGFIKESKERTILDKNAVHKIKKTDDVWKSEITVDIQNFIKKDLESTNLYQFL